MQFVVLRLRVKCRLDVHRKVWRMSDIAQQILHNDCGHDTVHRTRGPETAGLVPAFRRALSHGRAAITRSSRISIVPRGTDANRALGRACAPGSAYCGGNPMISDSLLAFGLLLSTATQLRFGDTPFGPGEMCLAVWLGLFLCLQAGRPAPASNAALTRVVAFWLILIVAESVGAIVGFATELFFDTTHIIHDVIAYFFLFGLACTMALELASEHRRRRVTWLIVLFGAASLSLQVAHAYGLIRLPIAVDPWFFDRLRGWSHDPNQLGLAAALLTVLSIHLADTATARVEMIAAAACAVLAFSVGVLTKSDSFTVGILAAGAVFLAIKSSLWLATFKRGLTFRAALVSLALLGLPVLAVGALPLAPAAVDRCGSQIRGGL